MVIGTAVGLCYSWKLGLVCFIFAPCSILAVYLEARLSATDCVREATAMEIANRLAVEAVANARTVASLGCQAAVVQRFWDGLLDAVHWSVRTAHKRGGLFAYTQGSQFFAWGLTSYYGAQLVMTECMEYKNIYIVTNCVLISTTMFGTTFALTADFGKGVAAALRIFRLLERRPRAGVFNHFKNMVQELLANFNYLRILGKVLNFLAISDEECGTNKFLRNIDF